MKLRILFLSLTCLFLLNANDMAENTIRRSSRNESQRQAPKPPTLCGEYSYITPLRTEDGNIFIEGEYIYWKPRAYIPYATTMDVLDFGNDSVDRQREASNVKLHDVTLRRKSGFRVTLGFYLPPKGWTTSFQYNYLKRKNNDSANAGVNTSNPSLHGSSPELNTIWRTVVLQDANATFARFTSASASQRMSYQVFDWILNKTLYRKAQFALSPYFGVRGTWIRNKLDVLYLGNQNTTGDATTPNIAISDNAKVQSNYRGWGIRGGFAANWMMGGGLEIFGNSSTALVWGKHDMRHRENWVAGAGDTSNNRTIAGSVTSHNNWRALRAAFQVALGLNWGYWFSNDSMYFGLKASYEGNYWPNLLQLRKLLRDRLSPNLPQSAYRGVDTTVLQYLNSDLSVHGLVVGAKFDF